MYQIGDNISEQSYSTMLKILQFGDNKVDLEASKILLMSTIEFILSTERLSRPIIE